jgi:hypothetical protein
MIYFLALLPATILTVAGYFVLYLSHRSEGTFRAFGKYLGFWAFTLAALVILAAIFAAAQGRQHRGGPWMRGSMYGPGPWPRAPAPGMYPPPRGEEEPRADETERGESQGGAAKAPGEAASAAKPGSPAPR